MPRINSMKVTNIHYGERGQNRMRELHFDAKLLHTLLLLMNGGGKSTLLLLLMQCVLPKSRIGLRKLSDYLDKSGGTSHSAIEWMLDGDGKRNFLIAAISFHANDSGDLVYHMWTYVHQGEPGVRLEDLSFLKDERPITMKDLREMARALNLRDFNVYDTQAAYYETLRSYNIHREHWENIRTILGAEGGIELYFAEARSTRDLVERIFIPAVENAIYASEDIRNQSMDTFQDHYRSLAELPMREQAIKDFTDAQEHMGPLLQAIKHHEQLKIRGDGIRLRLQKARLSVEILSARVQEDLKRNLECQGHIKDESLEIKWKKESHEVFVAELDAGKAEREKKDCEARLAKQGSLVSRIEWDSEELAALNAAHRWLSFLSVCKGLQTEIENMEASEPELQRKLQMARTTFAFLWRRKMADIEDAIAAHVEDITRTEALISEFREEQEKSRERRDTVQKRVLQATVRIDSIQEAKNVVIQTFGFHAAQSPSVAIDLESHEKIAADKEAITIGNDIQSLCVIRANMQESIIQLKSTIPQSQAQCDSIAREIKSAKAEFRRLAETMRTLGLPFSEASLLSHAEAISQELGRRFEARRKELNLAIALDMNLRAQQEFSDSSMTWIPNPALIKVQGYLKDSGIDVILGAEWLAGANLSHEEKRSLVDRVPFLPFGIMVESRDMPVVAQKIRDIGDGWDGEYPLGFFDKKWVGHEAAGMMAAEAGPVFFSMPGLSKAWDREDWSEWIEGIAQRLARQTSEVQRLEASQAEIGKLKNDIDSYAANWDLKKISDLESSHESLSRELADAIGELHDTEAKIKTFDADEARSQERFEASRRRSDEIAGRIAKLQDYERTLRDLPELLGARAEAEREYAALQDRDKKVCGELNELVDRKMEIGNAIQRCKAEFKELEKDSDLVREVEPLQSESPTETIDSARSIMVGLQNSLNRRHKDAEGLHKQLETARRELKDERVKCDSFLLYAEERAKPVVWEDLLAKAKSVDISELEDAKRRVRHEEGRRKDIAKDFSERDNSHARCLSRIDTLRKSLRHDFPKYGDPYDQYTEIGHRQEFEYWQSEYRRLSAAFYKIEEAGTQLSIKIANLNAARTALTAVDGAAESTLDGPDQDAFYQNPNEWVAECQQSRENLEKALAFAAGGVAKKHQTLMSAIRKANNPRLAEFLRAIDELGRRLFEYEEMKGSIERMTEGIHLLKVQTEQRIQQIEHETEALINQLVLRARTLRRSIVELPSRTRIGIQGQELRLVNISRISDCDDAEASKRMRQHLLGLINDMRQLDDKKATSQAKDSFVAKSLDNRSILNVICPLDQVRVSILKPDPVLSESNLIHTEWTQVSVWSEGEKFAARMIVFLMLVGHIKAGISSKSAWQAVFVDNPFGKASSKHILDPVFALADTLKIQLISCTGHADEEIIGRFGSCYSLSKLQYGSKGYLTIDPPAHLKSLHALREDECEEEADAEENGLALFRQTLSPLTGSAPFQA